VREENLVPQRTYIIQRVGADLLVALENRTGTPQWQHSKGLYVTAVITGENAQAELRTLAITHDADGYLRALRISAPDKSTAEEKRLNKLVQRDPEAQVAWELPIGNFRLFAPNTGSGYIICVGDEGKSVNCLEANRK
jgi:hypothetical protein